MDKDKIFNTCIYTDIASLYPKRCYIPYEDMYELERIRKAMKEGTKVTPIRPVKRELFGEIGTVIGIEVEHGLTNSFPTATIEVIFDKFPGQTFTFRPDNLALINVPTLEEFIMKNTVPVIKKVIFNDPATIVFWGDGTKTVVKAVNEPFDPEKGLAMAIAKYHFGNEGNYYNVFRKWLPKEEKKEPNDSVSALQNFIDSISNFGKGE